MSVFVFFNIYLFFFFSFTYFIHKVKLNEKISSHSFVSLLKLKMLFSWSQTLTAL